MRALAILKDAFKADSWRFLPCLFLLCLGLWALVSAEWASRGEESPKWATGAFLAGGIGFLGVACANALSGHVKEAVLSGLAAVFVLVGAVVDWRRTSALSSSSA